MNIAMAHGPSSRGRVELKWFGSKMCPWHKIHEHYLSYTGGGAGPEPQELYSWEVFEQSVYRNCIVMGEIWIDGRRYVQFGIEFMADERGPYCQWMYILGLTGTMHKWGEAFFRASFQTAAFHSTGDALAKPRMKLRGRPGWVRWLRRRGVEVSEDGWIYDQEAFHHGWRKRKQ